MAISIRSRLAAGIIIDVTENRWVAQRTVDRYRKETVNISTKDKYNGVDLEKILWNQPAWRYEKGAFSVTLLDVRL